MQQWYLLKLFQELGGGTMKENGWGDELMKDISDTVLEPV
jgi:hypothetical protein